MHSQQKWRRWRLQNGFLLYTKDGYWYMAGMQSERSNVPRRVVKRHLAREEKYNDMNEKRGRDYHDRIWHDVVRAEKE